MKDFNVICGILCKYKGIESHVVIPKGVSEIGMNAFYKCDSITSLQIPSSVLHIGKSAFFGCDKLASIKIPNSVTEIGERAFYECSSLENIEIPNSVNKIGYGALAFMKQVKSQYNGTLRAFKAFNKNWTCRNFQYEVGKSYHQNGVIQCCFKGFHACPNPLDVFNYYYGNLYQLRFAEVELSGDMDWDGNKVAASDIRIIRELTISELAEIYNIMEKK